MFCPNCRKQNADTAVYCEFCGASLQRPVYSPGGRQNAAVQPFGGGQNPAAVNYPAGINKKPVTKEKKFLIVELIILILVCAAVYIVGGRLFSAQQAAENYFVYLANGDWKSAYDMLDLEFYQQEETGIWLDSEMFAQAMETVEPELVSTTVQVTEEAPDKEDLWNDNTKKLTVHYYRQGELEDREKQLRVNRLDKKKYFLFDQWKVDMSDSIVTFYNIYVPDGARVSVDGMELTADQQQSKKEGYAYAAVTQDSGTETGYGVTRYDIPAIFCGLHTFKVTLDDAQDVVETVRISSNGVSYYDCTMWYDRNTQQELTTLAQENMKKLYTALIQGKSFSAVKELFDQSDSSVMEQAEADYNELLQRMHENGFEPVDCRFANISATMPPTMVDSQPEIEVDFEYVLTYSTEDWDGSRVTETTDPLTGTCYLLFARRNGSWLQTNLGCGYLW